MTTRPHWWEDSEMFIAQPNPITYRVEDAGNPCAIVPWSPPGPAQHRSRPDWDAWFLAGAQWVAQRADCRRRQVGCLIVMDNRIVSSGYNGAPADEPGCLSGACPRGLLGYDQVREFTDYDSGPGRCISIHAEANALLYAWRSVEGATAYITDPPCPTCSKLLAGAKIARIVTPS